MIDQSTVYGLSIKEFSLSANSKLKNDFKVSEILSEISLVDVGVEYLDQILLLEPQIYAHPWSSTLISAEFEKNISFRLGFTHNDILIAYSFSYIVEDELHLLNLSVSPEFQNQGLGKYLLVTIIQKAKKKGVSNFYLEVRRSNTRAHSLYYAAGFTSSGFRKNYYSDNGEDAILMELHF